MKSFALASCLALVLISKAAFAGAPEGWTENYAQALAQAQTEHKKVLLDFTGSDWCSWCKKIDAEVFDTAKFKEYAAKHLVLVKVDFPNSVPQTEELKMQNKSLQQRHRSVDSPLCSSWITLEKRSWEQSGYAPGGPEAFIKAVQGK